MLYFLMCLILIAAICAFILAIIVSANKNSRHCAHQMVETESSPINSKKLISYHEKTMFKELRESVPECYIFVQVCLGAFLRTSSQGTRNKFDSKIADYVVTNDRFEVLAVIELDDSSHKGKEKQDAERDAMISEAGYKVLRYPFVPSRHQLRVDIISDQLGANNPQHKPLMQG